MLAKKRQREEEEEEEIEGSKRTEVDNQNTKHNTTPSEASSQSSLNVVRSGADLMGILGFEV